MNAQDIEIDQNAALNCRSGTVSNWGSFILSGGVFRAGAQSHYLGKLRATGGTNSQWWCPLTNSTLDVSGPAGTFLQFRDGRDASIAGVQILGWEPWTGGGSSHHIFFGTNSQALTADQLKQLIFVNPLGWPLGNYAARILSTGEIVPAPPPLLATKSHSGLIVSWPGDYQLLTATNVFGPYSTITGATSPFTNDFTDAQRYFRLTLPGP